MKSFKKLQTLGYLIADLPVDLIGKLNSEVDDIIQKKENKTLRHRNHILSRTEKPDSNYFLSKSVIPLNNFIKTIVPEYWLSHGEEYTEISKQPFFLIDTPIAGKKDTWVNVTKKKEFAIPHTHRGILSFVIWLKIPYDLKKEALYLETTNSIGDLLPGFAFVYEGGYQGITRSKCHMVPLDNSYENKIIIFPSLLPHFVVPFYTSDEYRISISGNITTNREINWPS